ncbi:MAG TPA: DHHA1 domain-containing protein, partial [Candidatus Paceibacterota bacterium]|nr:DHHA1 domain-containing protein [Candidatus Paceibacterota bacterium]
FLRDIGIDVVHYIPHRNNEGFGLNGKGIEDLAEQGVTLMITADCGTTDSDQIAFAALKGIETIVTDHHIVPDPIPTAPFALINPHRPDSAYPFRELCGAGTAWKLVQGMLQAHRPKSYEMGQEKWFLDLVGIATLSDMVPLVGENRMLAHFGLIVMRRARRPGLAALLKLLKIKPSTLTEDDVGFMISPRINAASRMGNPHTAARLLAAGENDDARSLAEELQALNDERKGVVAATVKEANKRLSEMRESPLIVLGSPSWRPGILGLVASALVETHGKPVFLWGREGGDTLKGSCRSDGAVNIVECMRGAADVFADYGGHYGAGGFSLTEEHAHELHPKLEQAYETLRTNTPAEVEVVIDARVELAELAHALQVVQKLAPFGVAHAKPLFVVSGVQVANIKTFGKTQNHLGLTLVKDTARAEGVAFFSGVDSFQKKIEQGMQADFIGHIELDWRGSPRLRVVDVL